MIELPVLRGSAPAVPTPALGVAGGAPPGPA
jgi:hypothetical protein